MTPATMAKREALKAKLLDIAEAEIAQGGIVALRARDLAKEAGCALGAIYTVVDDLGELAVAVNRRTVDQIVAHMQGSIDGLEDEAPADLLITLSQAYLAYAQTETNRWRTLFSIGLSETDDAPGFHDAITPLVELLSTQLERLSRFETSRNLDRNARAIFASVHGMIALGLEPRLAALQTRDLDRMVSRVVATLSDKEEKL
ncbi:TetR/AcrR family transcriptional regulator [Actibacterium sp. XHP0104]|uniref:TetR/AcrR family transcriptional regulator n=1 Tax=Actibacterium sp. XHP0104 TaxID=2984335 RepID=UPI0021E8A489|nr:TetR/AcrR family transcriptional regulator [Actibacterium sp. XHP0104]MCV2882212.1 TetR/AcrR family transcriptional regulator [Actibacterium sp. XHP0104]